MKAYLLEVKYQFLSLLRTPRYSVSSVLFPVMFYLFFGILMPRGKDAVGAATYVLTLMCVFGVMNAALFGLGAGVASDRGLGWLQVKRASPMPPFAYYISKAAGAMLFSLLIVAAVCIMGVLFGGVRLSIPTLATLTATLVIGALPFCALGFFLGYISSPNSAPAIVNVVAFPMAFCSGLWVPIGALPNSIQQVASVLPAYHLAQMGLSLTDMPTRGSFASHVLALIAMTFVFSVLAWIAWRKDEGKVYG